jgi:hypothetical protein
LTLIFEVKNINFETLTLKYFDTRSAEAYNLLPCLINHPKRLISKKAKCRFPAFTYREHAANNNTEDNKGLLLIWPFCLQKSTKSKGNIRDDQNLNKILKNAKNKPADNEGRLYVL